MVIINPSKIYETSWLDETDYVTRKLLFPAGDRTLMVRTPLDMEKGLQDNQGALFRARMFFQRFSLRKNYNAVALQGDGSIYDTYYPY